ncbi:MAG: hypothetical protein WCO00_16610 [Rhodospirillaceae bacterium]
MTAATQQSDALSRLHRLASMAPALGEDGAWFADRLRSYLNGETTITAALELPSPAGRSAIDDNARLGEMTELLASGDAFSVHDAARMIARTLPGPSSEESTVRRLERKYMKMFRQNN